MHLASSIALSVMLFPGFVDAQQSPETAKTGSNAPGQSITQNDIQELRRQVQTMKDLVRQMEMNLAFVGTTQSPLKHQFQLEIDMWKTIINEMDRKLNSSKGQ